MPKNMVSEGKTRMKDGILMEGRGYIYIIYEQKFAPRSTPKVFVNSSVHRLETRNYIILSTRGRRSRYSRPKVTLLAAASSTNGGRE